MGSVLQFAAFLSICWLIRDVVTHPNEEEDKRLNNKHSNRNGPDIGDFYFDDQKSNDDKVKTGRAIPQSAWSKENKGQREPVENKTGAQLSDEFSFKNALSYLLNMLHELKKDIFGIKEMASRKNTKDLTNSQDNSEGKVEKNKMKENATPKSDASIKNAEFEKENQKPKSNYITDYYQNNGFKFVDDDIETSSDESDDSSHKPNDGASMHEISKSKDDACISKCAKIKRKPDRYPSEAEETTAIPTSQTKIPEESDKEFDDTKDDEKYDDFKESTTKPSKMKKNNSKTSREETGNTATSKKGKCMKKIDNPNNQNEKNEPTKKPLKSAEILTTSPQSDYVNKSKSERSNQNKTTDNISKFSSPSPDSRSSGKNSQNKDGLDFDSKSGVLRQSTTSVSQSYKDVIYPNNIENKPHASGMSSEKRTYKKQQEQITSVKPEQQEQARNNAKPLKNNDSANEYSTVSLKSQEGGSEISNHEISPNTEIKDSPKESKGKKLNLNSSHTTVTYIENEPNSNTGGQQTSNSFDTGNTISPTTSGNITNTGNENEDPSHNLNGEKGTNENEKLVDTQQPKNDSETQRDSETEQAKTQQLNDSSEPEKSLKNNKSNNSNRENDNKEEDDNLASMTTNNLPSPQDSNRKIQNLDVEESNKPQKEAQKNKESLKNEMLETSPDQEYEYEEDSEDFDISDELTGIETDGDFNQNEEGELITNNRTEENNDEMNPDNTATVLRNESQISQDTGYVMEQKSQEQYDTFLEYFYKHSNNPLFQSLKNQSNNFSR